MSEALQRTALHPWHIAHGARMAPFAGWEMPIQYPAGPLAEHHLTRRSAGLFDIDHMGQFSVSGPDAAAFLSRVTTWDAASIPPLGAHYALMCAEDGGVIDDVFLYHLPGRWLVVVNAANRTKDYAWMHEQAAHFAATVRDISAETYMLALQGPRALDLLAGLTPAPLRQMPRFSALEAPIAGVQAVIGRTGYTGEDGCELFFADDQALTVWGAILDAGAAQGIEVGPVGLAARDSLRFEPSFALYGHEIDAHITPLEAGLGWACSFEHPFIGRQALTVQKQNGLRRRLIGLEMQERGVPRQGCPVAAADGTPIGEVVSGGYAPTLDKYLAHAFVPPQVSVPGTPLQVIIHGKPKQAVIVRRPFYRPAYRKTEE